MHMSVLLSGVPSGFPALLTTESNYTHLTLSDPPPEPSQLVHKRSSIKNTYTDSTHK